VNVKLYVGNLSFSTGDAELREAFSPHGNLLSASVVTDRDSGQSRGFGFVEYGSSAEAERATEAMNGFSLDGRALNVNVARPREGGGGGGGGGGRSFGGGGGGGGRDGGGSRDGGSSRGGGGGGRGGGGGGGKRW
jgi:RNA recognition motif-containing protein